MSVSPIRYAIGSKAWGECARSGQRMLLNDMVADPLTGLLVHPEWAEPPLMRPPTDIIDGVTLERPAPDLDLVQQEQIIYFGTISDPATGLPMRPLVAKWECQPPTLYNVPFLLTEDGQIILTEDLQPIEVQSDLYTEDGLVITTETLMNIQVLNG